ncbi:MAG: hypothetical protein ACRDNZ_22680, partial [Streptosporangiaceae bacterium]
ALTGLRTCAVRLAITVLLAAGVTACASLSSGQGPLRLNQGNNGQQGGISLCMANVPASGMLTWHTPVGFALDMYWDQSAKPLTITSVSLLDPHNLVLHGSVLYKMTHAAHALPLAAAWAQESSQAAKYASLADWRARQRLPGGVIPPVGGPVDVNGSLSNKINFYEIVVDVSATSPAGGWALGEVVRYQARGQAYTFKAETGLSIGSSLISVRHTCDAATKEMAAAFAARQ